MGGESSSYRSSLVVGDGLRILFRRLDFLDLLFQRDEIGLVEDGNGGE
jgi:hypothetical protein